MGKKVFVMHDSERENVQKMAIEDVQKFLKADGYDHLREKVYHKDITEQAFEAALAGVESTIDQLKKEKSIPKTTFKPYEDRLVIFPDEQEVMTSGGLYLPDANKNKPLKGTVVVVGPGKEGKGMQSLKAGDRVYYGKYAGTPFPADDGRELLIMRIADVFGLI